MNSKLQRSSVLILLFFCFQFHCYSMQAVSEEKKENVPAIIPAPVEMTWGNQYFSIQKENNICYGKGAENAARWIEKLLERANVNAVPASGEDCGTWNLEIDPSLEKELAGEGYKLEVNAAGIHISSATNAGLFYGIQTLRQLFPAAVETGTQTSEIRLRYVKITDKPRFKWRGSMLDIARSFLSKEYIKAHIDRMALYKLNRLHLHLSDDQGWRIEIKKYPKLTEIGGKSAVQNGRAGYLTQKEYRSLQEYAAERNIVIVPEIDMPGHIYAALTSYPKLNCEDNKNIEPKRALPPALYDGYKVGWSRLCLENPATYDFVDDIIKEIAGITKGDWLHIGGDEIEDPLYEEFIEKAGAIVQKHGKTAIGWEESAKADLSKDFVVQRWNGQTKIGEEQGIIDSFCKFFYLDHGNIKDQENTYKWCNPDGVSLEKVYSYHTNDPRVMGVEAPVWSELVISDERADDRLWPRSIAVAEVGWTAASKREFGSFTERLARHGKRLEQLGVHYFKSPEVKWEKATQKGVFSEELKNDQENE